MTKNRSMKIAVLVLALALLTSCFVGSTFAKYTSSSTGSGSAVVANWAFTVNSKNVTASEDFTFDFFSTYVNAADGEAETGVDVSDGKKLAPGTKGSFSFNVVNDSDVWAAYTIEIDVTSATQLPAGVKFATAVDGEYNLSLAEAAATLGDNVKYGSNDQATLYWMWTFDGDNTADTTAGIAGGTVTLEATITAVQLDQQP